jgi:hypothetical protein
VESVTDGAVIPLVKAAPLSPAAHYQLRITSSGAMSITWPVLLRQALEVPAGSLYAAVDLTVPPERRRYLRTEPHLVRLVAQRKATGAAPLALVLSRPVTLDNAKYELRRRLAVRRREVRAGRVKVDVLIVSAVDRAQALAALASCGIEVRTDLIAVLSERWPEATTASEIAACEARDAKLKRNQTINRRLYWSLLGLVIAARVLADVSVVAAVVPAVAIVAVFWILYRRRRAQTTYLVDRE